MKTMLRKKFVFPTEDSIPPRIEWCVTGDYGSLSFWFTEYPKNYEFAHGEIGYGGVENHYNEKSRPVWQCTDTPSHDNCHCNNGKCWHDGTSLWASEFWIPCILPAGDDAIWQRLEQYYHERMIRESDAA